MTYQVIVKLLLLEYHDCRQGIVETLTLTGEYLLTREYNVFEIL